MDIAHVHNMVYVAEIIDHANKLRRIQKSLEMDIAGENSPIEAMAE